MERTDSIATLPPVLVHRGGYAVWSNQAFVERFAINPGAMRPLKVRELLWSLGIQDPLAGIIADGAVFAEMEASSQIDRRPGTLHLRQRAVPGGGGPPHLMLELAEKPLSS